MAQCEEGTDGEWAHVEYDSINVGDRVRGRFEDEDGSIQRDWSEGVVSRKLDTALQLEGSSYYYDSTRTWQRFTQVTDAPGEGLWTLVPSSRQLRPGERARGESRTSGQVREGVVSSVTHQGHVMFEGQTAAAGSSRRWYRWVPAPASGPAIPTTTWERVRPEDMAVGDIVKTAGDTQHWGCDVPEGTFQSMSFGYVYVDAGSGGGGWSVERNWLRRVTAPVVVATSPPPFAAPQVGDRFNRTYARAERATRENCEATGVDPAPDGGWRVRYSWRGSNTYISDVRADGVITSGLVGRYELVGSAPAVESRPATSTALPERGGSQAPLPGWAVGMTLEQARKHIHDEARRLYRRGSNCYSGTRDFLRAAALPSDPDRAYPEPQVVDESELVRAFLAKVRTDALATAEDHSKSVREVEGYLTAIGLTAPRPTTRAVTVTVTVPADADVPGVLLGLGWQIGDLT